MKDEDVRADGFKRDRLEPNYFGLDISRLSTADLIAELEKRRSNKCCVCGQPPDDIEVCQDCLWSFGNTDNFKPSGKGVDSVDKSEDKR